MRRNHNYQFKLFVKRITVCFLLIVLGTFYTNAQDQSKNKLDDQIDLAKKHYINKEFKQTIKICNEILSVDPETIIAHLLLAEIYKDSDSLNLMIYHLEEASKTSTDTTIFFKLGEAFYEMENYSEALNAYNRYREYKYIPEKRQFLLASKMADCSFAIHSTQNHVEFNTEMSFEEFWPTLSKAGNELVFTKLSGGTDEVLPREFESAETDSSSVQQRSNSDNSISSKPKIVFFTACNRDDGAGSCDIYFTRFLDNKWSSPMNAGNLLNSEYWDAQPSFSTASNFLYFSSNRPNGNGEKDIWKAKLLGFLEDGSANWSEPENMGSLINSSGNEVSPVVYSENNSLYFASDSHNGMGGLDIFIADLNDGGNVRNFENLGFPTNTKDDEIGVAINSIAGTTYFSAGRKSNTNLLIYTFNQIRGVSRGNVAYVKASVVDGKTNEPIQTNIEVVDLTFNPDKIQNEDLNENGNVMLCLPLRSYLINVTEPGYMYHSEPMVIEKTSLISDPYLVNIKLNPIEVGAEIELYNIYYETDSYAILPGSEPELQKLLAFLMNNKNVKVEIQGHTDNTGNSQNNLNLSNLRARSIVDYLTSKNIELSRLEYKGYGDTLPIESNDTEKGRQLNRRTTVKILDN